MSHLPPGTRTLAIALASLAVLIGSGCGRRETTVEAGIREQVLHMGAGAEPGTIDPHTNTGSPESGIIAMLFEPLVNRGADGRTIIPAAAESWDISADGRTYTFHLRQDLRWSNGDSLTATDFKQSFLRAITPALGGEPGNLMYPVSGAEAFHKGRATDPDSVGFAAPDDRTFIIRLQSPMPHFLQLITAYPWLPVHRPSIDAHGGWANPSSRWTRPGVMVGNGAFVLESWTPNSELTVVRNPRYHDAARVRLNGIRFYPIDSTDTEERAFRAGQLHVTYELSDAKVAVYRRERPEVLRIAPRLGTNYLFLNTTVAPFTDARVRRAFSLAIDRSRLASTILIAGQTPASTFIQPGMGGFQPKPQFNYDADEARRLLAEAGFPGGTGLAPVDYLYNTKELNRDVAVALQAMWRRELGVEITLKNVEWKVFLEVRQNGGYQIARGGWFPFADEPTDYFQALVATSAYNDARWKHEEFSRLFDEASTEMDRDRRFARYARMEEIVAKEMPVIPLYFNASVRLVDTSVQGWTHNVFDDRPIEDVWLAGKN